MYASNLLLADSSGLYYTALANSLGAECRLTCCCSGLEALQLLRENPYDLVVLQLMLPGMDGITLLETLASQDIHPNVLALSPLISDYVLTSAEDLGISYMLRTPCAPNCLVARIKSILDFPALPCTAPSDSRFLARLLMNLGILPGVHGYECLVNAVALAADLVQPSITKELYPAVGKRLNTSGANVERSIRVCLDRVWDSRDPAAWAALFQTGAVRPTNGQLIFRLAQELQFYRAERDTYRCNLMGSDRRSP